MKKVEFGEITWTLIEIITRIPEATMGAFLSIGSIKNSIGPNDFLSDRLIEHLRNLKRSGYIELQKQPNSSYSVRLTTKGKIKNLENSKDHLEDGKIRIISYDIPETLATKRRQFCRSIRRIGFRKLQKSLWVCKLVKADEIDLIIDELELRSFVAYFVASTSNVKKHIDQILK